MFSLLLRDAGATVDVCLDPGERFWETRETPYDLVLLHNETYIEIDSASIVRSLRATSSDSAIILLTEKENLENVAPLFRAGISDLWVAPYKLGRVIELLGQTIKHQESLKPALKKSATPGVNTAASSADSLRWERADRMIARSVAAKELLNQLGNAHKGSLNILLQGQWGSDFEEVLCEWAALRGKTNRSPEVFLEDDLNSPHLETLMASDDAPTAHSPLIFLPDVNRLKNSSKERVVDLMSTAMRKRKNSPFIDVVAGCQILPDASTSDEDIIDELLFFSPRMVTIPALNKRRDDIPEMARRIIFEVTRLEPTVRPLRFDESAYDYLQNHPWSGNFREFVTAIRQALFQCEIRTLSAEHFEIQSNPGSSVSGSSPKHPMYVLSE